jgi:hypothetical protein
MKGLSMAIIINKSKILTPKQGKIIKHISHIEKKGIDMVKSIAKQFGEQSKKNKPKKIYFR